ncbi:MAG: phosphoribosylanthranilate isomerase [Taibaiella sp.]|nr:phosphoribosylanthranilate isomerase [Taibaiella sp.]
MKIKICGMCDPENINGIAALKPDYMGFIFYPESKRYMGEKTQIPIMDPSIKKVGVFVNAAINDVLDNACAYGLDTIQLHGTEDWEYCRIIRSNKLEVIKTVAIQDHLPVNNLISYTGSIDYFLFDTQTPYYGGSGQTFDWKLLRAYDLDIPFFISGGLGIEQVTGLKECSNPQFKGVDANSRLETAPGIKDIERTNQFIKAIRNETI